MQALIDLAPLAAFFITYYLGGIYLATAVLMIAMVALLLLDLLRLKRVPPMHLLSAVLVRAGKGKLAGVGWEVLANPV